jgi:hypothetical protein
MRASGELVAKASAASTTTTMGVAGSRSRFTRTSRSLVIYVETERALGEDEETSSCTLTIPDDAIAKVSA